MDQWENERKRGWKKKLQKLFKRNEGKRKSKRLKEAYYLLSQKLLIELFLIQHKKTPPAIKAA